MPQDYTPDNWVRYTRWADYHRLVGCTVTASGDIRRDYSGLDSRVMTLLDIDVGSPLEELVSKNFALARRCRCLRVGSDHTACREYLRAPMLNMRLRLPQPRRACPETADSEEISCRPQRQSLLNAAAAALDILCEMDSLDTGKSETVVFHWDGHNSSGHLGNST